LIFTSLNIDTDFTFAASEWMSTYDMLWRHRRELIG